MVFISGRTPSPPPLRADRVRVGVAAGVARIISLLLARVLPPRPKTRQNAKTEKGLFKATEPTVFLSTVSFGFDQVQAEKTGATAIVVNLALKCGSMLSRPRSDIAQAGIPGKWWRVKVGTEHTWIVERCRVSHCLSRCLSACLSRLRAMRWSNKEEGVIGNSISCHLKGAIRKIIKKWAMHSGPVVSAQILFNAQKINSSVMNGESGGHSKPVWYFYCMLEAGSLQYVFSGSLPLIVVLWQGDRQAGRQAECFQSHVVLKFQLLQGCFTIQPSIPNSSSSYYYYCKYYSYNHKLSHLSTLLLNKNSLNCTFSLCTIKLSDTSLLIFIEYCACAYRVYFLKLELYAIDRSFAAMLNNKKTETKCKMNLTWSHEIITDKKNNK